MVRRALLVMLSALCSSAMFAQSPADEAAVISATLHRLVTVRRPDLRAGFLVAPTTTGDLAAEASDNPSVKGLDEAWSDYRARNRAPLPIPSRVFPRSAKVAHINRQGSSYDWVEVVRQFPGAALIVDVSRPGFQDGGNTAVVRCDVIAVNGPVTQMVSVFEQTTNGWLESESYFPVGKKSASPN